MDTTGLIARSEPTGYPPVARGYIVPTRPQITLFTEDVYVVLPEGSTEHLYGPCKWGAIHGTALPAPGAACVVVFDEQDFPTVVWWEGPQQEPVPAVESITEGMLTSAVALKLLGKERVTAEDLAKQEPWKAAELKNSWTVFSSRTAQYVKDLLGWVTLRGEVTGGVSEKTITVLPEHYRPGFTQVYAMPAVGVLATGALVVEASGNVIPSFATGTNFDLSAIRFYAEN